MTTNYPTHYPRRLTWKGEVKGETVSMVIEAGELVPADHEIKDNGGTIDGYPAEPGYLTSWGTKFPFFIITNWTIRWHGRPVPIPRGLYTSIFTPDLKGPNSRAAAGENGVRIFQADHGRALVVTIFFGYDGVTGRMAFVITKKGGVHRHIVFLQS